MTMTAERKNELLNTPRDMLRSPADKATQRMMYEGAAKAARAAKNEKLAKAIEAKYAKLAPTTVKQPLDRKAIAAKAKESRAANALAAFADLEG